MSRSEVKRPSLKSKMKRLEMRKARSRAAKSVIFLKEKDYIRVKKKDGGKAF